MPKLNLDTVGYWTEIKLSILREYSKAYAQILTKQQKIRHFAYIDGFAGAGTHISKSTGQHRGSTTGAYPRFFNPSARTLRSVEGGRGRL